MNRKTLFLLGSLVAGIILTCFGSMKLLKYIPSENSFEGILPILLILLAGYLFGTIINPPIWTDEKVVKKPVDYKD